MHQTVGRRKILGNVEHLFDDFENLPKGEKCHKCADSGQYPRGIGQIPVLPGISHQS